MVSDLMKSII